MSERAPLTGVQGPTDSSRLAEQPKLAEPPRLVVPARPRRPQVGLVAFEPRLLRRSVVTVLALITLWMVALWAFAALSDFLFLVMLSWLFAIAMEPAIAWLCSRGMRRGSATGVVGGAVLLLAATLAAVFGNLFLQQASALVQALPDVVSNSVSWLNRTFHLTIDAATVTDRLKLNSDQLTTVASDLAGGFFGIVTSLVRVVFDGFTFVVFAFYLAADGPRIRQTIGSWLTPARQEVFVTVWDIAVAKTGGYVVSKVVLAIASAFFHGVVFSLIGVPYWLPLALLAGITAQFIPVVGTYIGIVVPVLFVVFTAPLTALWIVLFATVYQQVETYVFTPRVSRRTMDVNSGIALAAVFVGAAFWGPIGALIGIPLAAAVVAVVETYGRRYQLVPALQTLPVQSDDDQTADDQTADDQTADDHQPADAADDHRLAPDARA